MEEPKPPYTTVASTFDNLLKKEYLTMRRFGNVKVFKPKITEPSYKRHFLSAVVKDYFENSYKQMVSFFVEKQKITAEELQEIIKLIEKK